MGIWKQVGFSTMCTCKTYNIYLDIISASGENNVLLPTQGNTNKPDISELSDYSLRQSLK
jgi:hypothetical protein